MIVLPWERDRAQAVADATRRVILDGVSGADLIAPQLTVEILPAPAVTDPNIRAAAYGMAAAINHTEPWQALALDASFGVTNYGGGNRLAQFYLEFGRTVHLRGLIAGAGLGVPIAQLPAGYRPDLYENAPVMADGYPANLVIQPDGWMYINIAYSATPENYASLLGVHFDIRP